MATKQTVVYLVLEIHCRVGDAVRKALRAVGRDATPYEGRDYASVWVAPPGEQRPPAADSLEQEGMVRVYGPAPIQDAEIYREKLGFVLTRSGCEVENVETIDD
jgi:hypothetical protein